MVEEERTRACGGGCGCVCVCVCSRIGVQQRGREETWRRKFYVRTRRINGCFWRILEKGVESERGSEKEPREKR